MRLRPKTTRLRLPLLGGLGILLVAATLISAPVPPLGEMVDAGGHRLYVNCTGKGTPTVILENGWGNTGEVWQEVQSEIEKFTQVCSYDHAGLGRSEAGPMPRTSAHIVRELHTALKNAGVAGPYVLAGHSLGGAYVRHFARLHPDEVTGLVLVDGSHEDQVNRLPVPKRSRKERAQKLQEQADAAPEKSDDPEVRTRRHFLALRSEMLNFPTLSADEIRAAPPLPPIPLVVLVHGKGSNPDGLTIWKELQLDIASRSPLSTLLVIEDAGHYIQRDRPDVVIKAIREMVTEARP